MCILVLKPPRERPSFSSASPPFFRQLRAGGRVLLFHQRNESPNRAFLESLLSLADVVRVCSRLRLFATDKTVWLRFPTFRNVLADPATVPPFLVSIGCHSQPDGGHYLVYLFAVFGAAVMVLALPIVHCLTFPDSSITPCLRSPIFRIQRV